jgi:hypothetical protein
MNNRYLRDILPVTPSTDVDNVIKTGTATAKVILLPTAKAKPGPFQQLTVELVLAQYRAGTLPEAVIVALLAGVGAGMSAMYGTAGSHQIGTDGSLQILELAGRGGMTAQRACNTLDCLVAGK